MSDLRMPQIRGPYLVHAAAFGLFAWACVSHWGREGLGVAALAWLFLATHRRAN